MYVSKIENYTLSEKDELVLTFQNGELMLLINNKIKVNPPDIKIEVSKKGIHQVVDGKTRQVINILKLECTVEE